MRVTGEHGVAIDAAYPDGLQGRALRRRDLDAALLRHSIDSGVTFEPGVVVERPIVDDAGKPRVVGVSTRRQGMRGELRRRW